MKASVAASGDQRGEVSPGPPVKGASSIQITRSYRSSAVLGVVTT
jgi:hypothetical protein